MNIESLIALCILGGGLLLIFLFLFYNWVNRQKNKKDIIDSQTRKERDDESYIEDEDEDEEGYSIFSLAGSISVFIAILIGTSLMGPISKAVNQRINETAYVNGSGGHTLLQFIPAFWALGIFAIGIAFAFGGLRREGFI